VDHDPQLRTNSYQQLELARRQEERAKRQERRDVELYYLSRSEARAAAQERAEAARHAAARAAAAERERAQAEARRRHVEAMEAHAEERNAWTVAVYEDLERLLTATLEVDDHVDLERFRVRVEHPPFPRPDLLTPIPPPEPLVAPPEPVYEEPPPPSGVGKALGGDSRHAKEVYKAQIAHWQAHQAWQVAIAELPARQAAQIEAHRQQEAARQAELAPIQAAYDAECRALDESVAPQNAELDALLAGLATGDEAAVQEYIGIVVTTSAYPPGFPVSHQYEYNSFTRHLKLWMGLPQPQDMPPWIGVRYDADADALIEVPGEGFDVLYALALYRVALRSLHVAFECDRRALIESVSAFVGVHGTDPALGTSRWYPLVEVEHVTREGFAQVNLAAVQPVATLRHFGARLSLDPLGLAEPSADY
jgi:restriction system protein